MTIGDDFIKLLSSSNYECQIKIVKLLRSLKMLFWISFALLVIMSLTTMTLGSAPVDKKEEEEERHEK